MEHVIRAESVFGGMTHHEGFKMPAERRVGQRGRPQEVTQDQGIAKLRSHRGGKLRADA